MATEQTLTLQTERMLAHIEDGIGWMTFNNPARHNALSLEMWEGIGNILEHFATNDSVRVVIMRGAGGKAFVSGADISEFDKERANAEQRASYGVIAGRATQWLSTIEKPLNTPDPDTQTRCPDTQTRLRLMSRWHNKLSSCLQRSSLQRVKEHK